MVENKLFDASLKRTVGYGILVLLFTCILVVAAHFSVVNASDTLEVVIDFLPPMEFMV
jgi:hypothetical protein